MNISFVLALVAVFTLIGCGKDQPEGNTIVFTPAEGEDVIVSLDDDVEKAINDSVSFKVNYPNGETVKFKVRVAAGNDKFTIFIEEGSRDLVYAEEMKAPSDSKDKS